MNKYDAAKKQGPERAPSPLHPPDPNIAAGQAPADAKKPVVPVAKEEKKEKEEIPIAGRIKMEVSKNQEDKEKEKGKDTSESEQPEKEDQGAKDELNSILKQAPSMCPRPQCTRQANWFVSVIIFSKTYCPFSKKAKSILLEKYSIVPKPYVVELDQHPMGKDFQDLLGESTGRRTVPNILVGGKSVGGGDEIAALDQSDELVSTLRQLGGKWVTEVSRQEQPVPL